MAGEVGLSRLSTKSGLRQLPKPGVRRDLSLEPEAGSESATRIRQGLGRAPRNSRPAIGDCMKARIPYTKPSITDLEVEYATDAARSGWGDRCYEYIGRFEQTFKTYLGTEFSIATSSCTGALHMGMAALGIGPGDEIIMADTNWIATASPIVHLGAKPVFVDILPDSWCIDPDLKLKLRSRPGAKRLSRYTFTAISAI